MKKIIQDALRKQPKKTKDRPRVARRADPEEPLIKLADQAADGVIKAVRDLPADDLSRLRAIELRGEDRPDVIAAISARQHELRQEAEKAAAKDSGQKASKPADRKGEKE